MKKVFSVFSYLYTVVYVAVLFMACSSVTVIENADDSLRFSQNENDDLPVVTGRADPLSVTFEDGDMIARWDGETGTEYLLTVTGATGTSAYTAYSGLCNLSDLGYTYRDGLDLTVACASEPIASYRYTALSEEEYARYCAPVQAGFRSIDYYIANRDEWFDFFSYLVFYRENAESLPDRGSCSSQLSSEIYIAYDYTALYSDVSPEKAFLAEINVAAKAMEESAAFAFSAERTGDRTVRVGLTFDCSTSPTKSTDTAKIYTNARHPYDPIHYGLAETVRTFPVDAITNKAVAESGDQLFFCLEHGYRPLPVAGSRAESLYNEMRSVLSKINADTDTDYEKIHQIYDYLVDTTLFDYTYSNEILSDTLDSSMMAYKCIYLEGVFGWTEEGYSEKERVAVCDGFAKAVLCMSVIEGIPCVKVCGGSKANQTRGHSWNKVQLDGNWYIVDATWGNELGEKLNSRKEYLTHEYFLTADDEKHFETPYHTYPKATQRYFSQASLADNNGHRQRVAYEGTKSLPLQEG